jgi:hypothetical protein
MSPAALAALNAAADNRLYRICGTYNLAKFINAATGEELNPHAVKALIAMGLLGDVGEPELIPGRDNQWGQLLYLSEAGLDRLLAVTP